MSPAGLESEEDTKQPQRLIRRSECKDSDRLLPLSEGLKAGIWAGFQGGRYQKGSTFNFEDIVDFSAGFMNRVCAAL